MHFLLSELVSVTPINIYNIPVVREVSLCPRLPPSARSQIQETLAMFLSLGIGFLF